MDLKDTERDEVDCSRLIQGMNQWRVLLLTVKNRSFYITREKPWLPKGWLTSKNWSVSGR